MESFDLCIECNNDSFEIDHFWHKKPDNSLKFFVVPLHGMMAFKSNWVFDSIPPNYATFWCDRCKLSFLSLYYKKPEDGMKIILEPSNIAKELKIILNDGPASDSESGSFVVNSSSDSLSPTESYDSDSDEVHLKLNK